MCGSRLESDFWFLTALPLCSPSLTPSGPGALWHANTLCMPRHTTQLYIQSAGYSVPVSGKSCDTLTFQLMMWENSCLDETKLCVSYSLPFYFGISYTGVW